MNKIKKNDTVFVLSGKNKGKMGRVFKVFQQDAKALVEGVNYVKKHARKSRDNQTGGIVQKESPIRLSKLSVFCKTCKKPAKVGVSVLADGTSSRYCKRCKEAF